MRNLRTAHMILKEQNGGRCRKSGYCPSCETEEAIKAAQEKRRMDTLSWLAAGAVVGVLVLIGLWSVL